MDSPIGVFDSGLGGLTVARRIFEKLPHESITFVGDEIHIPYGERTPQQIRSFALGICDFLIGQGSKLIVMACNMSSATALDSAKEMFPDTPIIGVIEAGVRAALHHVSRGPIGVLATTGTARTRAYTNSIQSFAPDTEVFEQACPRFVPLVEAGKWNTPEAESAVREYTEPLIEAGCRTLILGCTHYPFLAETITSVVGEDIVLIDPAEETAVEAANILFDIGMLNPPRIETAHTYFTSAEPDKFAELGSRFTGMRIYDVEQITWEKDLRTIECQEKTAETTINSAR